MVRKNKGGKELVQTKDQTPLLPLSGTRKVVRTPINPFEVADAVEVFVPKEIIVRRIQHIFTGPNKGRKADHYLVVWEDYPLEKDYTWDPIYLPTETTMVVAQVSQICEGNKYPTIGVSLTALVQQLNVCLVSQV